ncbi:MAG: LysM peptidoglycan-binding domain-containing protein [Canibacter sp.]
MNTLTPQERPTLESTTASPQASSKLRLTRRGRLVFGAIGAIAIAGVIAGGALLGPASAEATSVSSSSSFGYVLPAYGDSLWSIAERLDPNSDPRDLVYELVQLNNLPSSALQANEAIAVPLRYTEAPGVVSASEAGVQ